MARHEAYACPVPGCAFEVEASRRLDQVPRILGLHVYDEEDHPSLEDEERVTYRSQVSARAARLRGARSSG